MKLSYFLPAFLALEACAAPTDAQLAIRADEKLAGYLGVFFEGEAPDVYFYLSNGNNALSFKPLNKGEPILVPKLGTGGVRDPSIINGGGFEAGKKWYITGTDLDAAKTNWDAAQRKGSLSIYIWESTDLINWGPERLVKVENDNAGMAWAPDAIWDPEKCQYLVHWASNFYNTTDHLGKPEPRRIRFAHTKDFKTFTTPKTFISVSPDAVIDLALIELGSGSYARFLKNQSAANVYMERSDTGLFGTWTRPGGDKAFIRGEVEGPYAYKDNLVKGKVHLLLDYLESDGYKPFSSTNLNKNDWADGDLSQFPKDLRHGSVIGVTKKGCNALKRKWG